jgi:hypothetical protein
LFQDAIRTQQKAPKDDHLIPNSKFNATFQSCEETTDFRDLLIQSEDEELLSQSSICLISQSVVFFLWSGSSRFC